MRTARNPLYRQELGQLPAVVLCVITHLPEDASNYHAGRLEVVQTCLTTMRERAGVDAPVWVWDNGSGSELRDWLLDEYRPEYLTLGPNIGKTGARTAMLRAFPPQTVVAMSDDDMYYYDSWLGPQIDLLDGFPNVGAVSGYPVRTQARWGIKSTLEWARKRADRVEVGRFIPDEWDRDFCISVGRDYMWHVRKTTKDMDVLIEYRGLKALASAHHCQFVCYAGRLADLVEWDDLSTSDERPFDLAVDVAGMLRLTTTDRLVQHIGNVMEARFMLKGHPERKRVAERIAICEE